MHIGHVELPVSDPLASGDFYVGTLGFELVSNQGDRFLWVRSGPVELLLRPGAPGPVAAAADAVNLVLYSDDLDADVARLADRGIRFQRIGNCHEFRDPDGYCWQLVDPGDDHSAG